MKIYPIVIFSLLIYITAFTQPAIEWEKSFGGSDYEWPHGILQSADGNFILISGTSSTDGDINGDLEGGSGLLLKIDEDGDLLWSKSFGGNRFDTFFDFYQDAEGNLLIFGSSEYDGVVPFGKGRYDMWLVKLDQDGELIWENRYGGPKNEFGYKISPTNDGGYILIGQTNSTIGNVTTVINSPEIYIVKVDFDGQQEWEQTFGGAKNENGFTIVQMPDGGYIAAGRAGSINGDVTSSELKEHYWVLRLDTEGEIIWDRIFNTTGDTWDISLIEDDNAVIVAVTDENEDYKIFKLSYDGDVIWERIYGGSEIDRVFFINRAKDGGLLVGGGSYSNDGDVDTNYGDRDSWIMKLNSIGDLEWQFSYGGSDLENATALYELDDECFIVTNGAFSSDIDVSVNLGEADIWVVKFCANQPGCGADETLDINLTGDIISCENPEVSIAVESNFELENFTWDGPTTENINGNELTTDIPGLYTLIGFAGSCVDTVAILIDQFIPTVYIDEQICKGDTLLMLDTLITSAGDYTLSMDGADNCDTLFTIHVEELATYNDTFHVDLCKGESYEGFGEAGIYQNTFNSSSGCDSLVFIEINIFETESFLGQDINICGEDSYTITSALSATTWFDSSISSSIEIEESGIYMAEAVDENDCSVRDTLHVEFGAKFYMPNAFSPNDDMVNDYCRPFLSRGLVTDLISYEFEIFDRWGSLLYYSDEYVDVNDYGWNGISNNRAHNDNVVVFVLKIETENCSEVTSGNITLIK